jgi:hypothetical protein
MTRTARNKLQRQIVRLMYHMGYGVAEIARQRELPPMVVAKMTERQKCLKEK